MSKLTKIKEKLVAILAEVKMSVIKTNNGVLEYDGNEDLVAGMNVYVTDEETNERVAAADGEYVTEDGKIILVKDGKVESITDPVAEVDAENEVAPEGGEPKAESGTTETIEENVNAEEVPNPDGGEEKPVDAIEELRKEVNELYKIVDAILDKIGENRKEVDMRLSKIEKLSADKPADEVFETNNTISHSTGNKKFDDRLKELSKNWRD